MMLIACHTCVMLIAGDRHFSFEIFVKYSFLWRLTFPGLLPPIYSKFVCVFYMHSSYTTVHFIDLYIQCVLVYNYSSFKTALTFCLNITGDIFSILFAMEFHIFHPDRLTVYLIMFVLCFGFLG